MLGRDAFMTAFIFLGPVGCVAFHVLLLQDAHEEGISLRCSNYVLSLWSGLSSRYVKHGSALLRGPGKNGRYRKVGRLYTGRNEHDLSITLTPQHVTELAGCEYGPCALSPWPQNRSMHAVECHDTSEHIWTKVRRLLS